MIQVRHKSYFALKKYPIPRSNGQVTVYRLYIIFWKKVDRDVKKAYCTNNKLPRKASAHFFSAHGKQDIMAAVKWPLCKVDMPKASPAVVGMPLLAPKGHRPASAMFQLSPRHCYVKKVASVSVSWASMWFIQRQFVSFRTNMCSLFL